VSDDQKNANEQIQEAMNALGKMIPALQELTKVLENVIVTTPDRMHLACLPTLEELLGRLGNRRVCYLEGNFLSDKPWCGTAIDVLGRMRMYEVYLPSKAHREASEMGVKVEWETLVNLAKAQTFIDCPARLIGNHIEVNINGDWTDVFEVVER